MVREVVIRCDLCWEPAETFLVTLGAAQPRTVDLCPRHDKELLGPLRVVLDQHGVAPDAPSPLSKQSGKDRRRPRQSSVWKQVGPFRCLAGCVAAPLKNRSTLAQHLRGVHKMTFEEYVETYGEPVALTPEEAAQPVEVRCPVKGCPTLYSTALGNRYPQLAMVSHMRDHHGDREWRPTDLS